MADIGTIGNVLVGDATLYYGTAGDDAVDIKTNIGYTEDGVSIEYAPEVADIDVEEQTVTIKRVITKEEISITCNMAESALDNLTLAMAGADLAGLVITLGGGELQSFGIRIVGTAPEGFTRTIYAPYVNPTGTVGMSYKRGEKTIVPVTLKAYLYEKDEEIIPAVTITDVVGGTA
jgi:hypothetical protein